MKPIRTKKPTGLMITQQGIIDRHSLTPESSLIWGEKKDRDSRPCWLTPPTFRTWKKGKYTLLPSSSLQTIALPGDHSITTSEQMIARAYKERFQLKQSNQGKNIGIPGGLTANIIAVTMAVCLVLVMTAMGLPQAISEWTNATIQETTGTGRIQSGSIEVTEDQGG